MKRTRFIEPQIVKGHEGGRNAEEIRGELDISRAPSITGRLNMVAWDHPTSVKRLKYMEEENTRLKRIYAELSSDRTFKRCDLKKAGALQTKRAERGILTGTMKF